MVGPPTTRTLAHLLAHLLAYHSCRPLWQEPLQKAEGHRLSAHKRGIHHRSQGRLRDPAAWLFRLTHLLGQGLFTQPLLCARPRGCELGGLAPQPEPEDKPTVR